MSGLQIKKQDCMFNSTQKENCKPPCSAFISRWPSTKLVEKGTPEIAQHRQGSIGSKHKVKDKIHAHRHSYPVVIPFSIALLFLPDSNAKEIIN
jgi:hypothetical protein